MISVLWLQALKNPGEVRVLCTNIHTIINSHTLSALRAASWPIDDAQDVNCDCSFPIALAMCIGAALYPTRYPVIECDFEKPFTVTVRSIIPDQQ
jgi:hypothetical protein